MGLLLVLRTKNEKGAGLWQRYSFFLQLQVSHWSRSRAEWNFGLLLFVVTYGAEEMSTKVKYT